MKNKAIVLIGHVGEYILLTLGVFWVMSRRAPPWRLVRNQLFDIGVMSLPVVAITGFSTGMVLAAQSFFQLSDKGLADATGIMVVKAMLVELGPVLTAFMITGRVGSAMCAELGSMQVTEQMDALKSMAVDPNWYLLGPRFIGGIIMVPLLTIFSCVMGIVGGYIVAVYYYGMTCNAFLDPLPLHVDTFDFISGLVKALFFGLAIVTISCYRGIATRGGAAGVGKATTNSVVICYSVILISNFILTVALNNSYTYLTS